MTRTLTRWWLWLHLLSVAALLWQPSTPAVLWGRYSRNALLIMGVLLLAIPALLWAARKLPTLNPPTVPSWVALGIGALAVGVLWGVPVASAVAYKVIRLYITFVVFTALVWLLGERSASVRRGTPALVAVSLALVVVAALRFPGVLWTDEGYMISTALGFNQNGYPLPLYWQPYESASFSLGYMGLGAWLRVFDVSHTAARYFILLLGVVTIGITGYVAWLTHRDPTVTAAVVIAGLFAVSYHNVLRQDVLAALFLAVGLLLFVLAEQPGRVWLHYFVGLFVALSIDGHPLAYRLGLGFGFAYAVEYTLLMWRERRWWWAPFYLLAAGGMSGVALYLLFYSAIAATLGGYTTTSPFTWDVSLARFGEQVEITLQTVPVLAGLAAGGCVAAVRRNTRQDRLLLIVSAVGVVVLSTLYPIYRSYYQVHTLPLLMLLGAGAVAALPRNHISRIAAVLLVTAAGAGYLLRGASVNPQDYRPAFAVADELREVVPPDVRFAGVDPFYVRMSDYDFFEQQAILLLAQQRGIGVDEAWEVVAPEAVAIVRDYPLPPPPGLTDYIERYNMQRVHCWTVETLGQVDLYMTDALAEPIDECTDLGEGTPP